MYGEAMLLLGGVICLVLALIHLVVIFPDTRVYQLLVPESLKNQSVALGKTPLIVKGSVYLLLALYGFSGAGILPILPLIGVVLMISGLILVPSGIGVIILAVAGKPARDQVGYLVHFLIGVLFLFGCLTASGRVFRVFE